MLIGAPYEPVCFFRAFLQRIGVHQRLHRSIEAMVEKNFGFHWTDLTVTPPPHRPDQPALVLHDRHDSEVDYEDAERIVGGWPGAELVGTQGLGHQRILRDPGVVERAVTFVRE